MGVSVLFPGVCGAQMEAFEAVDGTAQMQELGDAMKKGRGPAALDAEKRFIRFGGDGAQTVLQLDCHPKKQNYLTVKIWGNSGSGGSSLVVKSPGSATLVDVRKAKPLPGLFITRRPPSPWMQQRGMLR